MVAAFEILHAVCVGTWGAWLFKDEPQDETLVCSSLCLTQPCTRYGVPEEHLNDIRNHDKQVETCVHPPAALMLLEGAHCYKCT